MFNRTTVLMKPLRSGVSGHVRLWMENGCSRLRLTMRGAPQEGAVLYAYRRGEADERLGEGRGVVEAKDFRDADALMVVSASEPPRPLLAGLCRLSGDDALLTVRAAAEALCRRLSPVSPPVVEPPPAAPDEAAVPREVFLPAIDPLPHVTAADEPPEPLLPPPRPCGPPADRLPPLRWPRGFEVLKPYFEKNLPRALFPMPGWRFVQAAQGLWVGVQREDGWVRRVAYACEGRTPPAAIGAWRALRGQDGQWYQVLEQEVREVSG